MLRKQTNLIHYINILNKPQINPAKIQAIITYNLFQAFKFIPKIYITIIHNANGSKLKK